MPILPGFRDLFKSQVFIMANICILKFFHQVQQFSAEENISNYIEVFFSTLIYHDQNFQDSKKFENPNLIIKS